jgi:hypothetical protein
MNFSGSLSKLTLQPDEQTKLRAIHFAMQQGSWTRSSPFDL